MLKHSHYFLHGILRNCISMPKMSYSLRTVDPHNHKHQFHRFDNAVRNSLERIMGGPVTNDQWKQATLPVSLGGLGFRSALLNSPGAFLRSLIDSSQIMKDILGEQNEFQDQDLVDLINSCTGENEFCLEEAVNSSQKVISHAVESNLAKELKDGATNEREKARLNAVSLKHSGDWLNAVPVKALGLHMQNK